MLARKTRHNFFFFTARFSTMRRKKSFFNCHSDFCRHVQCAKKDSVHRRIQNASAKAVFPDRLHAPLKDPNALAKAYFQDMMTHTFNGAKDFSRRVLVPRKGTFADLLTFTSVGYFYRRSFAGAFSRRVNASAKIV